MKKYIHESELWTKGDCPKWIWDNTIIIELLARIRHKQGMLVGSMLGLGFDLRTEASLKALTTDIVKSSAIEGETLADEEVRSSIARQLGLNLGGLVPSSRSVDGFVKLMLDATSNYKNPLTKERLFAWHKELFNDMSENSFHYKSLSIGDWRKDLSGKMQVVSGRIGMEKVHYEAISAGENAENLEREMQRFLQWVENEKSLDPVLKSAIAHLWFVTIHPFDDGNGRIARAISDMLLARSEQCAERFYSMSSMIEKKRSSYYEVLQKSQSLHVYSDTEMKALTGLDINSWLSWFLECIEDALNHANKLLENTLDKAKIWAEVNKYNANERQQLILRKLLDNFEGKLTSTKYAKLAKCSQDTAQRDINLLIEWGILAKSQAGGRSTSYELIATSKSYPFERVPNALTQETLEKSARNEDVFTAETIDNIFDDIFND